MLRIFPLRQHKGLQSLPMAETQHGGQTHHLAGLVSVFSARLVSPEKRTVVDMGLYCRFFDNSRRCSYWISELVFNGVLNDMEFI